mmetsp:Transcript_14629/g.31088  ORF Transcript_14629/g.31088 Transcript_14629/m.31088 type:complete len:93 (-) Transcript_14629:458-736(-)
MKEHGEQSPAQFWCHHYAEAFLAAPNLLNDRLRLRDELLMLRLILLEIAFPRFFLLDGELVVDVSSVEEVGAEATVSLASSSTPAFFVGSTS